MPAAVAAEPNGPFGEPSEERMPSFIKPYKGHEYYSYMAVCQNLPGEHQNSW